MVGSCGWTIWFKKLRILAPPHRSHSKGICSKWRIGFKFEMCDFIQRSMKSWREYMTFDITFFHNLSYWVLFWSSSINLSCYSSLLNSFHSDRSMVFFCRFCGTNFVSNSGTLGSQISSAASSHPQKLGWWTVINNLRISTIAAFPPSVKNDEQILPQMVKITSASTISTLKPPPFSNNNRPGRWPVWRPSSVLRRPVQPLWTAWAMGSRRSWRTLARIWVWWWLGERCSLGANHLGWS